MDFVRFLIHEAIEFTCIATLHDALGIIFVAPGF